MSVFSSPSLLFPILPLRSQKTATMDDSSEKSDDGRETRQNHVARPLRYRTGAFWLLGIYISLISIPWILTCVLANRPINSSSYTRQQGFLNHDISNMRKWKIALDVLNSITGLITSKQQIRQTLPATRADSTNYDPVPVLSALLAQAAVVFCQRQKPDEFLSLMDMFALADRGWTSVPLIWRSIRMRQKKLGRKSSAAFLLPAAGLILFGALQQPLYQILVREGKLSVTTCRDIPSWRKFDNCTGSGLYRSIGRDIEPAQMAVAEHLVIRSRMASDLASISIDESQSNLWNVNATYDVDSIISHREFNSQSKSLRYRVFQRVLPDFFVAGIPVGSTTGVLRQHLMRLNSSLSCEEIDPGDFPSPCPGDRPFIVSYEGVVDTDVRICVPGNYTAFPWTLSRSRQEHIEEMYIDIKDTYVPSNTRWNSANPPFNTSSTIRCMATTTRGYFELGNDWNNNTYGPLLEHWPDAAEMAENFNDWTDTRGSHVQGPKVASYVPSDMYVRRRTIQMDTDARQRQLSKTQTASSVRQS
jgi:hypothetical protein